MYRSVQEHIQQFTLISIMLGRKLDQYLEL